VVHGHDEAEVAKKCAFLQTLFPGIPADPMNAVAWEHIMFNSALFVEPLVKQAYLTYLDQNPASKNAWREELKRKLGFKPTPEI
jgi:hypothetical protein